MNLLDTVALVTGAGHRLGRAIAIRLAEAGCHVIVHYGRSREAAGETAEAVRRQGRDAVALAADLSRPDEIDALFRSVEERFGRLDVLVNSAASFERRPFEQISAEDWDAVAAVNTRAPFLCTRNAARLMREAADRRVARGEPGAPGSIVNLGDLAGVTTWRGYAHHGVSKAALLHLTKTAARELAPDVRVNAIVPGPILPPPGEEPESDAWQALGERVPLGRPGRPSHIADSVVFLSSNDYVTGEILFVDGGERLLAGGNRNGG